jgi:hypothetical protein
MIQHLPTHRELLRGNRLLPDRDKQSMVMLRFRNPISTALMEHFTRIHLTRGMKAGGEQSFYRAEVFQSHRTGRKNCPRCHHAMPRTSLTTYRCQNRACKNYGLTVVGGPRRGVIRVDICPEFVVRRETCSHRGREFERVLVDRCLLVLDRRYREEVLSSVYRTAGEMCEMMGWELL